MRLTQFTITVRDYDEAIAYYTRVLGFELVEDTPRGLDGSGQPKRWVRVRPPGSDPRDAGILLARAANERQAASVGNQTGGRVGAFLHTDDFWREYHALKARGAVFQREPEQQPYGMVAVFQDLYGNLFDLIGP